MDAETKLPYWPAALNKKLAAAYCGLSTDTFDKVCPVKPVSFTGSSRGERYLRQRLDEWLVSIDPNKGGVAPKRKFGDRLYGGRNDLQAETQQRPSMADMLYPPTKQKK